MKKEERPTVKQHLSTMLNEHYLGKVHEVKDGVFNDRKEIKVTKHTKPTTEKAVKECLKKAGIDLNGLTIEVEEKGRLVSCFVREDDGDFEISSSVLLPFIPKSEELDHVEKADEPVKVDEELVVEDTKEITD